MWKLLAGSYPEVNVALYYPEGPKYTPTRYNKCDCGNVLLNEAKTNYYNGNCKYNSTIYVFENDEGQTLSYINTEEVKKTPTVKIDLKKVKWDNNAERIEQRNSKSF